MSKPLYDFAKYYVTESVDADIDIDCSGIPAKSKPTSDTEDGETSIAEMVTNNVVYVVSGITLNPGDKPVDAGDSVVKIEYTYRTPTTSDGNTAYTDTAGVLYIARKYPLDDIVETGLVLETYGRELREPDYIESKQFDDSITIGINTVEITVDGKAVSAIKLEYTPRYALMKSPDGVTHSQNFEHMFDNNCLAGYAAEAVLGLSTGSACLTRNRIYKNLPKVPSMRAVLSQRTFERRIKRLGDRLSERDMAVEVTYYDNTFRDEVVMDGIQEPTVSDFKINKKSARKALDAYLAAEAIADYTKTDMSSKQKYGELLDSYNKFYRTCESVNAKNGEDMIIDNLSGLEEDGGTGTALVPNVSDAFKAYFASADDIYDEFTEAFDDLAELINANRWMRGNQYPDWVSATYKDPKAKSEGSANTLVIDMESLRTSLYGSEYDTVPNRYITIRGYSKNGSCAVRTWCPGNYDTPTYATANTQVLPSPVNNVVDLSDKTSLWGECYNTYGGSTASHIFSDYTTSSVFNAQYRALWDFYANAKASGKYSVNIDDPCTTVPGTDVNALKSVECCDIDSSSMSGSTAVDLLTSWFNIWMSDMLENNDNFEDLFDSEIFEWYVDNDATIDGCVSYVTSVRYIDSVKERQLKSNNWDLAKMEDVEDGSVEYNTIFRYCRYWFGYDTAKNAYVMVRKTDKMTYTLPAGASTPACVYDNPHTELGSYKMTMPLSAYLDQCAILIKRLNNIRSPEAYRSENLSGLSLVPSDGFTRLEQITFDAVEWTSYSYAGGKDEPYCTGLPAFYTSIPAIKRDDTSVGNDDTDVEWLISKVIKTDVRTIIGKAYGRLNNIVGTLFGDERREILNDTRDAYATLLKVIRDADTYQFVTGESVFPNRGLIDISYSMSDTFRAMPARFMVPVYMRRRKNTGVKRKRSKYTRVGVRWAEVRIVDTDVYTRYPLNDSETLEDVPMPVENSSASYADVGSAAFLVFTNGIPESVFVNLVDRAKTYVTFDVSGTQYKYQVTVDSGDMTRVEFNVGPNVIDASVKTSVTVTGFQVSMPDTSNVAEHAVNVVFNMPGMPYDDEIRMQSFVNFGSFDKAASGDNGWRIFHDTSIGVAGMRDGMGLHDTVALLVSILKNEFGDSRVELMSTRWSLEDSNTYASGKENEFTSWHCYGLAANIIIWNEARNGMISESSDDYQKLIEVAMAFTEGCLDGTLSSIPLNVVWCGRLQTGADNMTWEFLPIGVEHRDCVKFREAILSQKDPVAEYGFVDMDANHVRVLESVNRKVTYPYIIKNGKYYNGIVTAGGHRFVDPRGIYNWIRPGKIPLVNVIEFMKLIRLKMDINGSTFTDGTNSAFAWKSLNETSFSQLVMYYGLIGKFSTVRTLLGAEFAEKYRDTVDRYYTSNPVKFVKLMLGEHYDTARVFITDMGGGGTYVRLNDGRLVVRVQDTSTTFEMSTRDNFFGERMAGISQLVYGMRINGVFYSNEELTEEMKASVEFTSDKPVIDGYPGHAKYAVTYGLDTDGAGERVLHGDAAYLHSVVAARIKEIFDEYSENFSNYGGHVMYDRFADGPRGNKTEMLENEFGLITSQTLVDFDTLEILDKPDNVNEEETFLDSDDNGYRYDSIYERVVSNAQLSGVRKASLTREHVKETPVPVGMTVENLYELLQKGRKVTANDLIRR